MAIHKPNLLSHLERVREEGGQSLVKILFLAGLTFGSAVFLSFAFSRLIVFPGVQDFVWFLVSVLLFLSFFFLSALFTEDTFWFLVNSGLSAAGFFVFFHKDISLGLAASVIFFAACLFTAASAARREEATFTKIRIFRLAGVFLPRAFWGLALYLPAVFYFVPAKGELILSPEGFAKALFPIEKIVQGFYPDFNMNVTVGELVARRVGASSAELNAEVSETLKQLGNITGFFLKPEFTVSNAVYGVLFSGFTESDIPLLRYLPVLSLILTFSFLLRWFTVPFGWIISSFTYILYLLLLSLNFISIEFEGTEREVIAMK